MIGDVISYIVGTVALIAILMYQLILVTLPIMAFILLFKMLFGA